MYRFEMILICLDWCESVDVKPWDQRKDKLPKDLFDGCEEFEEQVRVSAPLCIDLYTLLFN